MNEKYKKDFAKGMQESSSGAKIYNQVKNALIKDDKEAQKTKRGVQSYAIRGSNLR